MTTRSRQRFFDLSLDLLCVASAEGYFLELNPRWEALLGWSREELTAEPFVAFVHPDDIDATVEETKKLQAGEETVSFENRYRCKDGSFRWLRWTSSFADGCYWAVARDVTAEKQAEAALRESEERFRRIFDEGSVGLAVTGPDLRFVDVNRAMCSLVGYSHDELLTKTFADITHPDDMPTDIAYARQLFAGEITSYQREKRYLRKDGSEVWVRLTASAIGDGAGGINRLAMVEDISARRQAEEALEAANEKLEGWVGELERRNREVSLMNELGDMLQSCRSYDEVREVLTKFAQRLFPMVAGTVGLIANSRNMLESVAEWGDADTGKTVFAPDDCWALRRGRQHHVQEVATGLMCAHLEQDAETLCIPLMAQGEALGLLTIVFPEQPDFVKRRSATDRRALAASFGEHIALALANFKLRETLRAQSIRDPLTGLFNRRYVQETLDRELRRAERSGDPVAVIACDLDHFKKVNDTYGHEVGDIVLREFAAVLHKYVRGEDIACRFGGEEFVIVLPGATPDVAGKRANEIATAVREMDVRFQGTPVAQITVSMGIAMTPTDGSTGEALLGKADAALYRAKDEGRDRVVFASSIG